MLALAVALVLTALHGPYLNRKGYRSVVLETVCDEDTYVWHVNVGAAGSNNDVNVLKLSPLYHAIVASIWRPRTMTFTVNNRTRTMAYYLADGIYPHYAFFGAPYPDADTPKKRTYNRLQEALRKDHKRLFLQSSRGALTCCSTPHDSPRLRNLSQRAYQAS